MGTSCSPFLANLTLFMFEFEWFSEQISRLRPWHLRRREQLMRLAFCTRYIDDLWNPLMEEATFRSVTAQMYPDWLPLGEPEARGQEINYLDMSIEHNNDTSKWSSKLYDKREAMVAKGLKLNKFPHPESMLTSRCKYGVITSQLHRHEVACSSKPAFMVSAVKLYSDYLERIQSTAHQSLLQLVHATAYATMPPHLCAASIQDAFSPIGIRGKTYSCPLTACY